METSTASTKGWYLDLRQALDVEHGEERRSLVELAEIYVSRCHELAPIGPKDGWSSLEFVGVPLIRRSPEVCACSR